MYYSNVDVSWSFLNYQHLNLTLLFFCEASFSDEDSGSIVEYFSSSDATFNFEQQLFQSILANNLRPSKDYFSPKTNSDSEFDKQFRKKARVCNYYQAMIPKYLRDLSKDTNQDELLWIHRFKQCEKLSQADFLTYRTTLTSWKSLKRQRRSFVYFTETKTRRKEGISNYVHQLSDHHNKRLE